MRGLRLVLARELGALFDSAVAWVYLVAFTVAASAIFMNDFFLRGVLDMTPWFQALPALAVLFVPAITMRTWAEERRTQTFELLRTLPLRTSELVVGKFLAVYAFYLLSLAGSLPIVFMLESLGAPDRGLLLAGYVGAALLGGLFAALGVACSAATDHQVVAFVLSASVAGLLVASGLDVVVAALDGLAPGLQLGTLQLENLSVAPRYASFVGGVLDLGDAAWFLCWTGLFLALNGAAVSRAPA